MIGLMCFVIALHQHGWRISFLGAATPVEMVEVAAERLRPDLITICAYLPGRIEPSLEPLRRIAGRWRLTLAGPAAGPELAARSNAEYVDGDPVGAAAAMAIVP